MRWVSNLYGRSATPVHCSLVCSLVDWTAELRLERWVCGFQNTDCAGTGLPLCLPRAALSEMVIVDSVLSLDVHPGFDLALDRLKVVSNWRSVGVPGAFLSKGNNWDGTCSEYHISEA